MNGIVSQQPKMVGPEPLKWWEKTGLVLACIAGMDPEFAAPISPGSQPSDSTDSTNTTEGQGPPLGPNKGGRSVPYGGSPEVPSGALAVNVDRHGNVYVGPGVNVGKSLTFISGSLTANWFPPSANTNPNNFLTNNSFSVAGGWGEVCKAPIRPEMEPRWARGLCLRNLEAHGLTRGMWGT